MIVAKSGSRSFPSELKKFSSYFFKFQAFPRPSSNQRIVGKCSKNWYLHYIPAAFLFASRVVGEQNCPSPPTKPRLGHHRDQICLLVEQLPFSEKLRSEITKTRRIENEQNVFWFAVLLLWCKRDGIEKDRNQVRRRIKFDRIAQGAYAQMQGNMLLQQLLTRLLSYLVFCSQRI